MLCNCFICHCTPGHNHVLRAACKDCRRIRPQRESDIHLWTLNKSIYLCRAQKTLYIQNITLPTFCWNKYRGISMIYLSTRLIIRLGQSTTGLVIHLGQCWYGKIALNSLCCVPIAIIHPQICHVSVKSGHGFMAQMWCLNGDFWSL